MSSPEVDYNSLMPFQNVVDYDIEDMFTSGKKRVKDKMYKLKIHSDASFCMISYKKYPITIKYIILTSKV